jgi:hypothetical protein
MSTAVHRSPKKLWRSNSIFNLYAFIRQLVMPPEQEKNPPIIVSEKIFFRTRLCLKSVIGAVRKVYVK